MTGFLAAFLAASSLLHLPARAQEKNCEATNLLAEAEAERPHLVRQLRQEAAGIPNGKGLLWRITKGSAPTSFLFGTMHLSDTRVLDIPTSAREAFKEARVVVIETTDVLDRKRIMASIAENPDLTMFPAEEDITDHLAPDEQELLAAALAERGMSLGSAARMKPWILMSLLSLSQCEISRQNKGSVVLDVKLAQDAQASGKHLEGLESFAEQLTALSSLPMKLHVQGLVASLRLGSRVDDMVETLTAIYLAGETGLFMPATMGLLDHGEEAAQSYVAFEEAVINSRNRVMAERAQPLLEEGGAFLAIGTMHLPGEQGLIELLREAGYSVERID
ncbi:TraB/GumN family protein [Chelativorans sp. Marseille-P2723]|uniref:TraB/GumN family protein n=1 Tax=Chelativorans sp. Marseille-P2723 TaxID=2709133 RepID=UPI00157046F0|nr:TraB/GumN family protein [Chelativorans sp. Marseille-P2723]